VAMTEQLRSDRQQLLLFSLVWLAATLWGSRYYPLVQDFDFSKLPPGQLNLLLLISLGSIFGLVMTAIYVYKVAGHLNSPKFSARTVTVIFVVGAILLGLFSFLVVAVLIWKSNKALRQ
jgi:hypothetical protein